MFLQTSVILLTGGGLLPGGLCIPACTEADTPPQEQTPPDQTPPPEQTLPDQMPPKADTPWSRHPPRADTPPRANPPRPETPQDQTPPGPDPPKPDTPLDQTHPLREAHSGIRSTSGRYASYWNAFLSSQYLGQFLTDFLVPSYALCTIWNKLLTNYKKVTATSQNFRERTKRNQQGDSTSQQKLECS